MMSQRLSYAVLNRQLQLLKWPSCRSLLGSCDDKGQQSQRLRQRCGQMKFNREASTKTQGTIMNVFDRKAKRLQKERAALGDDGEDVTVYDYLKDEFGYRISDRICDIKRKFSVAVDLGCGRGHVAKHLYSDMVERLFQCDLSHSAVKLAEVSSEVPTSKLVVDEEFIPFKDNSLDMVVSNLSLHWVNDLPGSLRQILQALRNDGVLIGSMFGGDSLYELRVSLQLAEIEREGGFAAHISPFTTVNDLGNLLTRAGFTMLTIDVDNVIINYPSMFELMFDLKGMAENNCSWSRKSKLHRDTMVAAAAVYKEMYGNEQGIPATFEVINFIGWKPDPSQPKAAARGSGEVSLKDISRIEQLSKQMSHGDHKTSDGAEAQIGKLEEELKNLSTKYKTPDGSDGGGSEGSGGPGTKAR
ncbi:arginine-hydroxylase NDUFAF5, mitochondrial [Aplysia californica]|uniref:Arginine-hydroxylase NDUFAF5, mitochondrial n=1 Tax=Aplysia californica TaxID=6500 RepID=A0ABM0JUU5_APLCA|nr:arginine-hydroxylase NDUFAF5, mitochondrial [Aplysia californica]